MPRRLHRPGAALGQRHGSGPERRRGMGLPGLWFPQPTVRLLRQALAGFGLGRTLALGRGRHGRGEQAWRGPSDRQQDAEP